MLSLFEDMLKSCDSHMMKKGKKNILKEVLNFYKGFLKFDFHKPADRKQPRSPSKACCCLCAKEKDEKVF